MQIETLTKNETKIAEGAYCENVVTAIGDESINSDDAYFASCSPDDCNPYCNPNCNPFEDCSPKCFPW